MVIREEEDGGLGLRRVLFPRRMCPSRNMTKEAEAEGGKDPTQQEGGGGGGGGGAGGGGGEGAGGGRGGGGGGGGDLGQAPD